MVPVLENKLVTRISSTPNIMFCLLGVPKMQVFLPFRLCVPLPLLPPTFPLHPMYFLSWQSQRPRSLLEVSWGNDWENRGGQKLPNVTETWEEWLIIMGMVAWKNYSEMVILTYGDSKDWGSQCKKLGLIVMRCSHSPYGSLNFCFHFENSTIYSLKQFKIHLLGAHYAPGTPPHIADMGNKTD